MNEKERQGAPDKQRKALEWVHKFIFGRFIGDDIKQAKWAMGIIRSALEPQTVTRESLEKMILWTQNNGPKGDPWEEDADPFSIWREWLKELNVVVKD